MRACRILALDLGSWVGWAFGALGDNRPSFGTWHLPETRLRGPRYVAYENELIAALRRFQPTVVVMAAPLNRKAKGGQAAARQQLGLAAYTEGECCRARVQLREVHEATARKDVLGRGRFPVGGAKPAAMAWAAASGFDVSDDHQADTLVLWTHACGVQDRIERY